MKRTVQQMAEEYARSYPENIREHIAKAWIDGRNSARLKEPLDLSFVPDEYQDIFRYWLSYKKERGQTYKQSGAEGCFRKLVKMSGNNPQKALAIIEQSIANNWAGLFELRDYDRRIYTKQDANNYAFEKFLADKQKVDAGISIVADKNRPF